MFDHGKIWYFHEYHFQWPFLKSLVINLPAESIGKIIFYHPTIPCPFLTMGNSRIFRDIVSNGRF